MENTVGIIILSLICSAFFSSIEIAFVSADPLRVALKKNHKGRTAKLLTYFYDRQDFFIGSTLIGNTVSLVVYGIFMAALLDNPIRDLLLMYLEPNEGLIETLVLLIQTILSTLLVLAVAEFLPKSLALVRPNKIIEFSIHIMQVVYWLLSPFVWIIINLTRLLIVRLFGIEYTEKSLALGVRDLKYYIQEMSDVSSEDHPDIDPDIFENAVEFENLRVRDCMIPRTEIVALDQNDDIEKLKALFARSGHSKIITYDGTIENVTGYCHALHLFKKPKDIKSIITGIIMTPETLPVNELLPEFIRQRKSIALVTDEFGGTAGIVTIEDVIEEIMGDIEDEHDTNGRLMFRKLEDQRYELSARYPIEDLNDSHKWEIPEGDYDTLGGLIMSEHGSVPTEGIRIKLGHLELTVKVMKGTRIDTVELQINEDKKHLNNQSPEDIE